MAEYSTSIDIEAPPEIVFAHLVTVEGMLAWMGQCAELDPVPGGRFAVDINGAAIRGSFLEVDPPHRVVVSWGEGGNEDFPPGSSCVEFTLTPTGSATRLDLTHRGLPDARTAEYAKGWQHFALRLQAMAAGSEIGSYQGRAKV